jgi:hypothetical protein
MALTTEPAGQIVCILGAEIKLTTSDLSPAGLNMAFFLEVHTLLIFRHCSFSLVEKLCDSDKNSLCLI